MSLTTDSAGPVRPLARTLREVRARLVGAPGAFFLRDEDRAFVGAFPVERSEAIDPEPGFVRQLGIPRVPRWVGLLPYEAFRSIERGRGLEGDRRAAPHLVRPLWHRYEAVVVEEGGEVRIEAESAAAADRLERAIEGALERAPATEAQPSPLLELAAPVEPAALHEARIRAALERIGDGQLYQVNLARRFEFRTSAHPFTLVEALGARADVPYAAALDFSARGGVRVVGASPELFLDASPEGRVFTRPIKGTRPRSADPARDLELRVELDASEKERAELAMVIDLERNDLGRLAEPGSVRVSALPHVVTHPNVHHREATVEAVLRPGIGRAELLRALLPSGSVTGAPKIRAMDLIAELESARRGLYTGALGYLAQDGHLRLSMAIRVLVEKDGIAHFGSGGGIVADSEPHAEVEETLWKAAVLRPLCTASDENWALAPGPG